MRAFFWCVFLTIFFGAKGKHLRFLDMNYVAFCGGIVYSSVDS